MKPRANETHEQMQTRALNLIEMAILRKVARKGGRIRRVRKLADKLMGCWYQNRRETIERRYDFVISEIRRLKI